MIKRATMDDLKAIQDGMKLYRKDGKFLYVRQDYLKRCIAAQEIFYDFGAIAVFHEMKRPSQVGTYKCQKGEIQVHQLLSLDKKNAIAPFRLLRAFIKECLPMGGRMFGGIWKTNQASLDFHYEFGYKKVGEISWSQNGIPNVIQGIVVAYDKCCDPSEFLV
jgi:hypothetical protein